MAKHAYGRRATLGKTKIAVFILALGFVLFAVFWFGAKALTSVSVVKNPNAGLAATAENLVGAEVIKDSDSDGLPDWEEAIYHTDPKNPDTDGDKTPDGQEVKDGRDPIKKGPSDVLPKAISEQGAVSSEQGANADGSPNLTFNLSQALIDQGVLDNIDASGNITSTDFLDNLKLPANLDTSALLAVAPISKSDLKIVATDDPTFIKNYFVAIASIYNKNLKPLGPDDITIFVNALQTKNYDLLTTLNDYVKAVNQTASDIQKLPTPEGYVDAAITEIQNLHEIARSIELMKNIQTDPVGALLGIKKRFELMASMAASTRAVKDRLQQSGILP